ncbi:acetoin reductase family protein [Mycena vitilis]|nr:acetoin reductase family protein [Mycena vitilis]
MSSKGVALVTGAAQGIGRGIALRLAEDGFDVAVNDLLSDSEELNALMDEIKKIGRASSKYIADVSQDEQVKGMIEQVVKQHGSLDVMVANAGIRGPEGPFEVSTEEWDRVMSINARGPFLCYKYAGMQMITQGRGGRIIGASSFAGKRGVGPLAAYSAATFAVRGITQAAALEFGAHGITVQQMSPLKRVGLVDLWSAIGTDSNTSRLPADIASLVSFLASKESQFITGQTISIDGGLFFD